jgi:hypothetical protein
MEPKKKINILLCPLIEELKELWKGEHAYDNHLKCDSTYMLPICGQSMIIWHMTNLLVGVSTVGSIVQYVMHSGWSTKRKSLSFIVIEGLFPSINHLGVTNGCF